MIIKLFLVMLFFIASISGCSPSKKIILISVSSPKTILINEHVYPSISITNISNEKLIDPIRVVVYIDGHEYQNILIKNGPVPGETDILRSSKGWRGNKIGFVEIMAQVRNMRGSIVSRTVFDLEITNP